MAHARPHFMKKHSDAKIIEIFGGPSALAHTLKLDRRVTHNWTVRGISIAGRYMIRDLAAKAKIRLPAGFAP